MSQPIRQIAEMERDLVKFMFKDAFDFVKKLITTMLDEPSSRDPLGKLTMKLNTTLPFLLMNDYRIS